MTLTVLLPVQSNIHIILYIVQEELSGWITRTVIKLLGFNSREAPDTVLLDLDREQRAC